MKPPTRKLGDPFESRIVLMRNGSIVMADGSDLQSYLKAVRRKWKVKGKVPIAIMPVPSLIRLENDAILARNWSA